MSAAHTYTPLQAWSARLRSRDDATLGVTERWLKNRTRLAGAAFSVARCSGPRDSSLRWTPTPAQRGRTVRGTGEHQTLPSEVALRVKALESLLIDKGMVQATSLDEIVQTYEHRIGPRNGARVVAKAWTDPA
jgi:hypothetical protein